MSSRYGILLMVIFVFPTMVSSQNQIPGKEKKKFRMWEDWSVNANLGQTSFFGDVSLFDDNLTEKLQNESDWGYGLIISKKINPVLSIGGQILFGGLKGQNKRSYFEAKLYEGNLNVSLNVVNLLLPENNSNFYIYGLLGVGQFMFNSKLVFNDPTESQRIEDTGVPEFVYMFGAGVSYSLSRAFDLTASMVMRQAQNDKLDISINNKDMDYYTYLCGGITYNIDFKKKPVNHSRHVKGRFPLNIRRK